MKLSVHLHFLLHHAVDQVAAADIVEGRFHIHEQCSRNIFAVPGLVGVADEYCYRIDTRTPTAASILSLVKLPTAL